jgi:hypothetical protein
VVNDDDRQVCYCATTAFAHLCAAIVITPPRMSEQLRFALETTPAGGAEDDGEEQTPASALGVGRQHAVFPGSTPSASSLPALPPYDNKSKAELKHTMMTPPNVLHGLSDSLREKGRRLRAAALRSLEAATFMHPANARLVGWHDGVMEALVILLG